MEKKSDYLSQVRQSDFDAVIFLISSEKKNNVLMTHDRDVFIRHKMISTKK